MLNTLVRNLHGGEIDMTIAERLKRNPGERAGHCAWDYFGEVWYDDESGWWAEEIWQNHEFIATLRNPSLEALIEEARETYGRA
jgi:hypothetical protein